MRPRPGGTVSTPVDWEELASGISISDFDIRTVPVRIREKGDLWRKLLWNRGRFELGPYVWVDLRA
ncbi:MAG: hypothetical protein WD766_10130 [Gemmatimonadota bacterium]